MTLFANQSQPEPRRGHRTRNRSWFPRDRTWTRTHGLLARANQQFFTSVSTMVVATAAVLGLGVVTTPILDMTHTSTGWAAVAFPLDNWTTK